MNRQHLSRFRQVGNLPHNETGTLFVTKSLAANHRAVDARSARLFTRGCGAVVAAAR